MTEFKVGDVLVDREGYIDRVLKIDATVPKGLVLVETLYNPHSPLDSQESENPTVQWDFSMMAVIGYKLHKEYLNRKKLDKETKEWLGE